MARNVLAAIPHALCPTSAPSTAYDVSWPVRPSRQRTNRVVAQLGAEHELREEPVARAVRDGSLEPEDHSLDARRRAFEEGAVSTTRLGSLHDFAASRKAGRS